MSKKSSLGSSQTDWQWLRTMKDRDIDFSDIPEANAADMNRGELRLAGKPIPPGTVLVPLDAEVVERFKARAGAADYQLMINAALRAAI